MIENSFDPDVLVHGDHVFVTGTDKIVCYDLKGRLKKWESSGNFDFIAYSEGQILASPLFPGEGLRVTALDAETGKQLWHIDGFGLGRVGADGSTIYAAGKNLEIVAIDRESRKIKWRRAVVPAQKPDWLGAEMDAIVVSDDCIVATIGSSTFGLRASDGELVWTEHGTYVLGGHLPTSLDVVWVPTLAGSVGRSLATGEVKWRIPHGFGDIAFATESIFVGSDGDQLRGIDPNTGEVLWAKQIGEEDVSGGYQFGTWLNGLLFARGLRSAAILREDGTTVWEGPAEQSMPQPIWTNGSSLLCFDGTRLLTYESGREEEIADTREGRRAAAERLTANWDELDQAEVAKLASLNDEAFEPVLKLFVQTCAAYDSVKEGEDSFPLYSKYHHVGEVLSKIASPARTADLLTALDGLPKESSAKPTILAVLSEHGDPGLITPFFIKELEGTETPGFEMYESSTYVAREYVANSSDPRAVAFMLKQLRDPKADEVLRYEAYVNLARTGGEEGLQEVLKQRNRRKLLRPLVERVTTGWLHGGEFGSKPKVLDEKKDASGKTWGLLESGVLGSFGDLWIAEKQSDKWVRPVFMGISGASPRRGRREPEAPVPTLGGKTAEQLKEGAWFEFVENKTLRVDSDKDGLTDAVEKRIGTDRFRRDTDGDGDLDDVDPWPNVAARPQTDEQKVMDAVFEARFHGDTSEGPAIIHYKEGMLPFEMVGRSGTVIWQTTEEGPGTLSKLWEQGTAFISFHTSAEGREGPDIAWNADRTEAMTTISTYYGGLNGTGYAAVVRKFGDQWVVVSMRMAYIS